MFNRNPAIGKIPVLSVYKYVGFTLIVILALTLTFTCYSVLTGLPEYTPDLFLPYQDILPNQPRESLASYHCRPRPSIPADRAVHTLDSCNVLPHNGAFHLINIIIKNNRIQETSFYSEYLQANQLMAQWDTPPTIIKTGDQRTRPARHLHAQVAPT